MKLEYTEYLDFIVKKEDLDSDGLRCSFSTFFDAKSRGSKNAVYNTRLGDIFITCFHYRVYYMYIPLDVSNFLNLGFKDDAVLYCKPKQDVYFDEGRFEFSFPSSFVLCNAITPEEGLVGCIERAFIYKKAKDNDLYVYLEDYFNIFGDELYTKDSDNVKVFLNEIVKYKAQGLK